MTNSKIGSKLTAREEMEEFAIQQGLIMVPEFQFDHSIYQINPESMSGDTAQNMKDIYTRCATFLRIQTRPNEGVVVIVSPRWFFMTVVTQAYSKAANGNPCYLDGFDFAGLVSLQTTTNTWPATAGLED